MRNHLFKASISQIEFQNEILEIVCLTWFQRAMLIEMIRYKAQFQNKAFITANTRKIKASQLDHISGNYKKYSLSTRAKTIGDELVQRDLYSAFILQHVLDDGKTVDLNTCDADFQTFLRNQEITMKHCDTELTSAGKKYFKKVIEL